VLCRNIKFRSNKRVTLYLKYVSTFISTNIGMGNRIKYSPMEGSCEIIQYSFIVVSMKFTFEENVIV